MRLLFRARILSVSLLACLIASLAYGQQGGRGQINGTVTDSSGAVISGAHVTIKNVLTGQTVAVDTNSKGDYTVPFLEIGQYTVSAAREGFETRDPGQSDIDGRPDHGCKLHPQAGRVFHQC